MINASEPTLTNAIAFLGAQSFESLEDRAAQTEALAASLADVTGSVAVLKALQQVDGGWGADVLGVFPNEVVDTLAVLRALRAAGAADTATVARALGYLLDAQNADGGWGAARGRSSEVFYTAQAVLVLAEFRSMFQLSSSLQSATAFLLAQQHPDGSFGEPNGTTFETALALQALVRSIVDPAPSRSAITALLATQAANGSWDDDAYATALAIRALADIKPNLIVAAATLSTIPATPQDGEAVTLTVPVHNTGLQDAPNVVVRFFLGDPNAGGMQIGTDQVVASIPSGGSAPVSTGHTFTGTGGRTIFVQVDPANAIAETSEADNLTSSRLWVATPPDLAVFTVDLVPSTFTPEPGVAFALEYTVRNLGEGSTGPLTVAVYDGDPGAGGALLTTQDFSGVSGAGSRTGTVGITVASAVAHTLYVVADSTNQITESSETNNRASVVVQVGATAMAADLAITPMDLTVNPARPQSGETVQITARFRNEGTESASNVSVELFDGAPESGGVLLTSATRTLAPGEEQSLVATWTATAGIHDLYVVLDRTNQLVEIKETNNQAVLRIMPDLVDLMVSATDLVFTPSRPVIGDLVTFTATVRNLGLRQTGAFDLALYDGDPAAGGVLLHTAPVSNLLGDATTTLTYSFTAEARTYRFYVVADPDGQVMELDEANNQAMRSLRIKAPGEILGPDLVPIKLDVDGATTNGQTLAIGGSVQVTIQNKGDAKITMPSSVVIFDDTDLDRRYTAGVDTLLGTADATQTLWPEGATLVTIPLAGAVRFLDAPLHVLVDAGDALAETDETNNHLRAGADCDVRPAQPIQPVVKWRWRGAVAADPNASMITMPPAMASLTDDNGDGRIDGDDIPDLTFIASGDAQGRGMLRALRGDTGAPLFGVRDPAHAPYYLTSLAAGDLDGDGRPEFVMPKIGNAGLLAFEHDGTFKWDNQAMVTAWNQADFRHMVTLNANGAPLLADLDADGRPEIVMGATIVNADGSIRCAKESFVDSGLSWYGNWYAPIVADLDGDGRQEIVAGHTAYRADCTILWRASGVPDGINAVGQFDDDPQPELVVVTSNAVPGQPAGGKVYLVEHDGGLKWGPVSLRALEPTAQTGGLGGPPVVADFDGDGQADIGVMGLERYFVLDRDGLVRRTFSIPYHQGAGDGFYAAPTVFDLNGDGRPEVLFNQNGYFRIFDGTTGTLLYQERFGGAFNSYQNVLIADVDGDQQAEAVAFGYAWAPGAGQGDGLRVYGSATNNWVNARRIWNQSSYHVTNINDDGTIPQYEAPSWLTHNTYRVQAPVGSPTNPYLAANLTASCLRAVQTSAGTTLTVRIGNGGAIAAAAGALVAFYDGDPAADGVLLGTGQTTRALAPGEFQDIVLTWTGAATGSHTIVALIDPAATRTDCDLADNRATLTTTIAPILPDLAVTNGEVQALGPLTEGRLIPVRVTVQNVGGADAAGTTVRLTLGDPTQGGTELGRAVLPAVAAGASGVVDLRWDSLGATGTNYLYAQVDPYTANETVPIAVTVSNSGPTRTVDLDVLIEDPAGVLVSTVTHLTDLVLAEGDTRPITGLTFNTGSTMAGDYRVRGRVREAGTPQAEVLAAFTIRPVVAAQARLVADQQAYSAHDTVTLTTTVTSQSPNQVLTDLTAIITITDPSGAVLFTDTRSLPDLLPGARRDLKSFWPTGVEPAGLYAAAVTVHGAGGLSAAGATVLEILSSADQAAALAGALTVSPATIVEREATTLTYTVQNIGNTIALPLIDLEVLVVDPDTELPVRTITAQTALNGREVITQAIPFDSTGLAPKAYLLVLRGTTANVTQALAGGGLVITPLPNEAPIAQAGLDRLGYVGQSVMVDGSASLDPDGDPLSFAWSFVSVPAGSQLTDAALIDRTTAAPSFVPDADGTYMVSLIVHDGVEPSQTDTVAVYVNPAPAVDLHPETINLTSSGGARSLTIVLASPEPSAFAWLTGADGVTVTAAFALENRYVDATGQVVIFTIPAEPATLPGRVVGVDGDGNGAVDRYELVLKADRQALIAGFTDGEGRLHITHPTDLLTTVIGADLRVGSDVNRAIVPGRR